VLVPAVVALVLLGGLGWYWFASLVPSTYSVMEMGHAEYGAAPLTSTAADGASPT
jgi:hypothetical protein